MSPALRSSGAALLSAAALACSEATPQPRLAEVGDSAGVRIVQNSDPQWTDRTRWRLDPDPVVQIGKADGDARYQFGHVSRAVRLSSGDIVVADQMAQTISMFDSTGRFLRRLGGRGKGPNEFTGLYRVLRLPGDSILAWDGELSRGTVYSEDGTWQRDFLSSSSGTRYSNPDLMVVLPDGRFIASTSSAPPVETPGFTPRHGGYWRALAILGASGAVVDTIGEYSIAPCPGTRRECSRSMFAPRGTFSATRTRVYYGFSDAVDIAVFDLDGRLTSRIRRSVQPVQVTKAATDSIIDAVVARSPQAARDNLGKSLRASPVDSVLPLFQGLLNDAEGNLWVGMITGPYQMRPIAFEDIYRRPMPARPLYSVFDTAGVYLGDVETPARFTILELGSDYILGVWQDELDVDHIRLYRLIKPS